MKVQVDNMPRSAVVHSNHIKPRERHVLENTMKKEAISPITFNDDGHWTIANIRFHVQPDDLRPGEWNHLLNPIRFSLQRLLKPVYVSCDYEGNVIGKKQLGPHFQGRPF